jgi:DNA-binding IscR family transcriptional regulator
MLVQIRRDIQARLEELLGEIDQLRRALTALASYDGEPADGDDGEPADGDRAAAVDSSAADQSAANTSGAATRRTLRTRKASVPPRPSPPTPASPAAAPASARTAEAVEPPAVEPPPAEPPPAEPPPAEPPPAEPPPAEPPPAEPPPAEPLAAEPLAGESPAVGGARRAAPGATRHAVLAVFARGSAMSAEEVATASGLARASVRSTLSQLAKAGELREAAGGYQLAGVEAAERFYFEIEDDVTPRVVAANLPELEAAIALCGPEVLRRHCAERDLSRWIAGVFHNQPLADAIAATETQLSADSPTETVEQARMALIAALQARHATQR